MLFFNNLNCLIKSYKQGLVFYKNYLRLNDCGSKASPVQRAGHQYTRLTGESVNDGSYEIDELSKLEGSRSITASLATGTIYGMSQTFVDGGRQQSYYGLNQECVTREGFPNVTLVTKYLRETAPSTEIKEQRINLYEDVLLANDFYDNATSLLAVLLIKLQRARMTERLSTFSHTLSFKIRNVKTWADIPDKREQWETLYTMVTTGPTACGAARNDKNLSNLKYAMLDFAETIDGSTDLDAQFNYPVKVWKMYDYDDGHSKSQSHFGDHIGFINNRFIAPANVTVVPETNELYVRFLPSEIPTNDGAIKHLKTYKYWVNTSNLTEKECTILQHCLRGNTRMTPLLIDQNIDFNLSANSTVFLGPEMNIMNSVAYNDNDIALLIHKLCKVHRWHEDLLNAAKLLRPWYCQPGSETVESHWWTYIHRVCRLPSLGLKRASIPCLLLGNAVCTSVEAVKQYEHLVNCHDSVVVDSLLFNTSWYWGEYMMIMNGKDTQEVMRNNRLNMRDDLSDSNRAVILVSSVLGEEVSVCSYEHCYTYIKGGLDGHKGVRAKIGHVEIPHLEEYGYVQPGEDVIFNSLVAPGCIAMLCGRAGSLLDGTPYHSSFKINPLVPDYEDGNVFRSMNYADLWAYGVVARWQGHDVQYKHPLRGGSHRIYCADDVNIAMPPTTPCSLRRPENYRLNGVYRREKSWGGDYSHRLTCEQLFQWTSVRFEVMSEPTWRAEIVVREELATNLPKYYTASSDIVANVVSKLSAKFDLALAGFHVDATTVGMPLRDNSGQSRLESNNLPTDPGDVNLPPPPPDD